MSSEEDRKDEKEKNKKIMSLIKKHKKYSYHSDDDEDIVFEKKEKVTANVPLTKKTYHLEHKNEFNDFQYPSIFIISGVCGSGKSHLLKYLLYSRTIDSTLSKKDKFQQILVFTGTKYNGFFDFLPSKYVMQGYSESKLKKYHDYLMKKAEQCKKQGKEMPQNAIVFDDIAGLLNSRTGFFTNMISTFRHTNTSIFILIQYLVNACSPAMRSLANYVFAFADSTERARKNLFDLMGSGCNDPKEFTKLFSKTTEEEYTALLFNARGRVKNQLVYSKFKAPSDMPSVKLNY